MKKSPTKLQEAMNQTHSLRIADEQDGDFQLGSDVATEDVQPGDAARGLPSHYADAKGDVEWSEYNDHYSFPVFIRELLNELGKDFDPDDARLVDEIDDPEDVHFGVLGAFPDESLLFVGSDPTAADAIPWFAFCVEPTEPVPAPETAQDALDMLKTPAVRDVEAESDWLPDRHGEWWLLPTPMMPGGTVFSPGVASRPYGPSPLGNHVPREYGFAVTDEEFMRAFRDVAGRAPASVQSPPEAIEWTYQQLRKEPTPDHAPTWAEVRECAGEVLVRGTVRHRENDHYVENLGETWHKAQTHDVKVYTGDGIAEDVHLDYHGL